MLSFDQQPQRLRNPDLLIWVPIHRAIVGVLDVVPLDQLRSDYDPLALLTAQSFTGDDYLSTDGDAGHS